MNESFMTRRQFLHRFGAVGGSPLVFGAMNAWGLMGASAVRRPRLEGTPVRNRVVVLGAGISGLAVGYELGKLGYDYRILEARGRVGGVSHTIRRGTEETEMGGERQVCDFDEGLYFNAGPWRIPHTHTNILAYCKELRVPLEMFVNETDAAYLYFEGEAIGPLSGKRVRLREVKGDLRGYAAELLAKAVDQGQLDLPLSLEDKERLVAYLVNEGYLNSEDRVYRGSAARGAEDPYDLASLLRSGFGNRVRSIDGGFVRSPMFQPVGGMDQIPLAFQRAIGDRITLNAEVGAVRQSADGVSVVYRDTGTGETHQASADYVVACLPLSVLSTLDVNLSPEMAEAVRSVPYSASAKIGVQMKRRFWEEDDGIYGGVAYTNLPLGQFSYPSNDFFSQKGVLLGFYGNGEMGGVSGMPVRDRIEHVIANGSKFHPQMREEFETGYCAFWEKIRYSNGAYTTSNRAWVSRLGEPDGRIFVGCAAVSQSAAWMDGAVAGAWSTVEKLHARAMNA
jgi:monoamine oxidase